MATLPRSTAKSNFLNQPVPDEFDSGINSSAAWTASVSQLRSRKFLSESNARNGSLSDDDMEDGDLLDDDAAEEARSARALYSFQGKPEFRELDVEAGDEIDVLKDDVGEGWSLVRNSNGDIGLLPQTYYTFTSEFSPAPDLEIDTSPNGKQYPRQREGTSDSITPTGSPRASSVPLPLLPQNTGEWVAAFPSFRHSLLGGKSLNRFSAFVTSGAEEFVLKGSPITPELDLVNPPSNPDQSKHGKEGSSSSLDEEADRRQSRLEADQHFVSSGPSWKEKVPPFRILVHSPSKRASLLSGAYTIYNVTSFFHSRTIQYDDEDRRAVGDLDDDEEPVASVTVLRRFSHFVVLHTALTRRLPGIALPPLPEKQYAGRFSDDFVEARRGDLERYLNKVVRHPVARYAEILTFFLSCESDSEWKRRLPEHLSMPPAGPAFYARVYHPAFNVDREDAATVVDLFDNHTKGVDKSVQSLRTIFSKIRDARIEMSKAERLLSYSFLSLITGKSVASTASEENEDHSSSPLARGLINDDGAWCWRSRCEECLKLTKAVQKSSETLQNVADLYDDHARRTQLMTHEYMKTMAHPSAIYEGVVTTHRETLSRYNEAVNGNKPDDDVANRCETVLNITMAEMDTYHNQKFEDFKKLVTEHLDGEINCYEQILTRLYLARRNFDSPEFDAFGSSPCKSSIYERELSNPKLNPTPLSQPCPHVYDSTPMRPVSVALQEGVNLFLSRPGRASVFSKFW